VQRSLNEVHFIGNFPYSSGADLSAGSLPAGRQAGVADSTGELEVNIPSGLNFYPVAQEDGTGVSKKKSTANLFREKVLTHFERYEE